MPDGDKAPSSVRGKRSFSALTQEDRQLAERSDTQSSMESKESFMDVDVASVPNGSQKRTRISEGPPNSTDAINADGSDLCLDLDAVLKTPSIEPLPLSVPPADVDRRSESVECKQDGSKTQSDAGRDSSQRQSPISQLTDLPVSEEDRKLVDFLHRLNMESLPKPGSEIEETEEDLMRQIEELQRAKSQMDALHTRVKCHAREIYQWVTAGYLPNWSRLNRMPPPLICEEIDGKTVPIDTELDGVHSSQTDPAWDSPEYLTKVWRSDRCLRLREAVRTLHFESLPLRKSGRSSGSSSSSNECSLKNRPPITVKLQSGNSSRIEKSIREFVNRNGEDNLKADEVKVLIDAAKTNFYIRTHKDTKKRLKSLSLPMIDLSTNKPEVDLTGVASDADSEIKKDDVIVIQDDRELDDEGSSVSSDDEDETERMDIVELSAVSDRSRKKRRKKKSKKQRMRYPKCKESEMQWIPQSDCLMRYPILTNEDCDGITAMIGQGYGVRTKVWIPKYTCIAQYAGDEMIVWDDNGDCRNSKNVSEEVTEEFAESSTTLKNNGNDAAMASSSASSSSNSNSITESSVDCEIVDNEGDHADDGDNDGDSEERRQKRSSVNSEFTKVYWGSRLERKSNSYAYDLPCVAQIRVERFGDSTTYHTTTVSGRGRNPKVEFNLMLDVIPLKQAGSIIRKRREQWFAQKHAIDKQSKNVIDKNEDKSLLVGDSDDDEGSVMELDPLSEMPALENENDSMNEDVNGVKPGNDSAEEEEKEASKNESLLLLKGECPWPRLSDYHLYLNDCRKNIKFPSMTKWDKIRQNCKMELCDVNGWPAIFVVTVRDLKPGEICWTYYGKSYHNAHLDEEGYHNSIINNRTGVDRRLYEMVKEHDQEFQPLYSPKRIIDKTQMISKLRNP